MRLATCLVAVAALTGALGLATTRAGVARASCTSGAHATTVRGRAAMIFCGRARATVHVGGQTYRYAHGECSTNGRFFSVSVGTAVTDTTFKGPKPAYFGITVRRAKPGTQANPAIAFNARGRSYALTRASITLAKGLRHGTFRGVVFPTHQRASGSFAC